MHRSGPARLLGEFLVIVVGVLVALAVDEWREYSDDRVMEARYVARLIQDLQTDSATMANQAERGASKRANLETTLKRLEDPALIQRSPSAAWPDLSFTFARPELQTTTFDELLATAGLLLIRDEALRYEVADHYRVIRHRYDRVSVRRTELAAAAMEVFPFMADAPDVTSYTPEWFGPLDSAFFAAPRRDERMARLLSTEFAGLLAEEHAYARVLEGTSGSIMRDSVELMDRLRAYQATIGR